MKSSSFQTLSQNNFFATFILVTLKCGLLAYSLLFNCLISVFFEGEIIHFVANYQNCYSSCLDHVVLIVQSEARILLNRCKKSRRCHDNGDYNQGVIIREVLYLFVETSIYLELKENILVFYYKTTIIFNADKTVKFTEKLSI